METIYTLENNTNETDYASLNNCIVSMLVISTESRLYLPNPCLLCSTYYSYSRGHHDRMVVEFTTTYAISAYHR